MTNEEIAMIRAAQKADYWAARQKPKPEREQLVSTCTACGSQRGPFEKNPKGQMIHRGCPKWTSVARDPQ